ncbi:MAG: hypothetical protein J6L98_05070 [Bacteroidales bacterium]|nr:hypothetical protein [Bacteroidales bacterium]
MIDIVITYVDGSDPRWIESYNAHVKENPLTKRYRDWGTLKYLFRGIERHIPFCRKVFLVVSSMSQVPSWMDTTKVSVVTHRDIIPERYLPTFNSSMIEMFLHRIPGLSEKYLYFNDDMFPVMDCKEEDFFIGGIPAMGISRNFFAPSAFLRLAKRSDHLARKALGLRSGVVYVRPRHICSPMLRSECESLSKAVRDEIFASLSILRSEENYNQYLFLDYMFYKGKMLNKPLTRKHFSLGCSSAKGIASYIRSPKTKIVCINDVEMPDESYQEKKSVIINAFQSRYPVKSSFEK